MKSQLRRFAWGGGKSIPKPLPEVSAVVDDYNLLQLGCSLNVDDMDYIHSQLLIYFGGEVNKFQEQKLKSRGKK